MKSAIPYAKIRKIISISLVYFDLGIGEDYAYHGRTQFLGMNKQDVLMLNNTQKELYKTEKIGDIYPEYYILKVNRFDDIARNTIDEWIFFFKNEEIKEEFTAKGLKEAKKELDVLKMSESERREYEDYLESLRYQASMFESSYKVGEMKGKKEGIKEGIKKGMKEGRKKGAQHMAVEIAKKLKEKGLDTDFISEASGLTKKEIENL
jgi:hypothetical protein